MTSPPFREREFGTLICPHRAASRRSATVPFFSPDDDGWSDQTSEMVLALHRLLFVSFTNATAIFPTDPLPLSRRAKLLRVFESIISLLTIALVGALLPGRVASPRPRGGQCRASDRSPEMNE
jgi:hypothetical protein